MLTFFELLLYMIRTFFEFIRARQIQLNSSFVVMFKTRDTVTEEQRIFLNQRSKLGWIPTIIQCNVISYNFTNCNIMYQYVHGIISYYRNNSSNDCIQNDYNYHFKQHPSSLSLYHSRVRLYCYCCIGK